jgi:hypothetical protein
METDYVTEDGRYLSEDELISLIKFQIPNLSSQGYTESEILNFDDGEDWKRLCKMILRLYKIRNLNY